MNRSLRLRPQTVIWLAMLWAAACLAALSAPAARAATCPPPDLAISQAAVVFVGTLTAVDAGGGHTTFAVEEVWKGDDVPAVVVLAGSPGQWTGWTPSGDSYLVIANVVGGTLQAGDGCNGPLVWDASLAGLRPTMTHPPLSPDATDLPIPLLVVVGAVLLVGGISALAFRTRRGQPEN